MLAAGPKRVVVVLLALSLLWFCAGCVHVSQTQACLDFVTCVEDLDALKGMDTNTKRFDKNGACWGSEAGMELCDEACYRGLAVLRKTEVIVPASCL